MHDNLFTFRAQIDAIDDKLLMLLAERFRITEEIGHYKMAHHLPAIDSEREEQQSARIHELSEGYGLDADFAKNFSRLVVDATVANHKKLGLE